ncbi:hypothetical protein [Salarchaeum japonicum]|uniref:DUF3006 domain-containing protein n=1 Tax=Salarchaeum japonicum TaxID=555573 RepID=A0AAV3SZB4_9EURY|nr:hypothetical protein [Salarchaeum japonicum]
MSDAETKTIEGFLTVNWQDETLRVRKTKPEAGERGRTELVLPISLDVHVPEIDTPVIEGDITVPAADVEASLLAERAQEDEGDS